MKFIEKNIDRFEITTPNSTIEVSHEFKSGNNFKKKLVLLINNHYESLFSKTLNESSVDIVLFSYDDMCDDLSQNEFGFLLKNIFYVIDYSTQFNRLDSLRGVTKIIYKVYKMECNFRFFQGSFPFQFLDSTSTVYKYIKINLTDDEAEERNLPF